MTISRPLLIWMLTFLFLSGKSGSPNLGKATSAAICPVYQYAKCFSVQTAKGNINESGQAAAKVFLTLLLRFPTSRRYTCTSALQCMATKHMDPTCLSSSFEGALATTVYPASLSGRLFLSTDSSTSTIADPKESFRM